VRNALTSKRTLLGLDNFETLNHAIQSLETLESVKVAKSLYAFFKSLPAAGVTLCVTSREKTNLPGEHMEEIYGLEDAMGGVLFYENVSTRKDALNEAGLEKLSAAVGGHPLALRLLAPIFEEQAGLSLEQFVEKLQTFLPKASDQWTEQERHESLGACFAFSMDNLPKDEEGEKLRVAISRLSVFIAFFMVYTAAPVIENHFPDTEKGEQLSDMRPNASKTLHDLWERGLLERSIIPLGEESFYLYRLHPTLRLFAKARLTNAEVVQEYYWQSMSNFARVAEEQIGKSFAVAQTASRALPDLLASSTLKSDENAAIMCYRISIILKQFGFYDDALRLLEKSRNIYSLLHQTRDVAVTLHAMASLYITRGDLAVAMILYLQSLETFDGLGDLQGKSTTLYQIAEIHTIRGDLNRAMKLFQQSLKTFEELGDLQRKSATLKAMASIYAIRSDLNGAMKLCQQSLEIDEGLGNLRDKYITLNQMATIYTTRGDLDGAMKLYQQSLEIQEGLGDLEGKSATLQGMANLYLMRGDLDDAMRIYQLSLKIAEKLGNLRSKASVLNNIGIVLVQSNRYSEALKLLLSALEIRIQLRSKLDIQNTIYSLNNFKHLVGNDAFQRLWQEVTGNKDFPEWLSQQPEEEQSVIADKLIAGRYHL